MSLDDSVINLIKNYLNDNQYCTRIDTNEISQVIVKELHQDFDRSIAEISLENERLSKRVDQLYDHIQKLTEPKFARTRNFFSFRWAKFWKNWL